MSIADNKLVMQRIWNELLNEGKLEQAQELIAEDFAYHGPAGLELRGIDGFKRFITWMHSRFVDLCFRVDDLIVEGDKVVSVFTVEGTYKNKSVTFHGVTISHLANGKETEVWEFFDRLPIYSQVATGLPKVMLRMIENVAAKDQP